MSKKKATQSYKMIFTIIVLFIIASASIFIAVLNKNVGTAGTLKQDLAEVQVMQVVEEQSNIVGQQASLIEKGSDKTSFEAAEGQIGTAAQSKEETEAKPLTGLIIGIDPGHQQKANNNKEEMAPNTGITKPKVSSGTQGSYTKVKEYELTLDVGLIVKEVLTDLGAEVIMTRDTHNINISNQERAILANNSKCDMVIRIHANGSENPKATGYSILIPGKKYTEKIVKPSTEFAQILDEALKEHIRISSEGLVTRDDLTGFNWSEVPVVLIEMGYMTNEFDDKEMQRTEFKSAVAKAIAQALKSYFDVK